MGIFERPKLRKPDKKNDMPDDLWIKCPDCGAMIHILDLKQNLYVCKHCDHHFIMGSHERIDNLADPGSFEEIDANLYAKNPLGFAKYEDKITMLRDKTNLNDAVVTGKLSIGGKPAVIAVMDFKFFAGSMGSVVGEKITRAAELALTERRGLIIVSASSGARMQELAEPGCMIGFAGPRVVKETTHQDLPDGFQTAEFMLTHGLLDDIVHRKDMKSKLSQLLRFTLK